MFSVFCMRNLYCMFLFLMRFINEFLRKIKGIISNFDLFSLFFFLIFHQIVMCCLQNVQLYIYIYIYISVLQKGSNGPKV